MRLAKLVAPEDEEERLQGKEIFIRAVASRALTHIRGLSETEAIIMRGPSIAPFFATSALQYFISVDTLPERARAHACFLSLRRLLDLI